MANACPIAQAKEKEAATIVRSTRQMKGRDYRRHMREGQWLFLACDRGRFAAAMVIFASIVLLATGCGERDAPINEARASGQAKAGSASNWFAPFPTQSVEAPAGGNAEQSRPTNVFFPSGVLRIQTDGTRASEQGTGRVFHASGALKRRGVVLQGQWKEVLEEFSPQGLKLPEAGRVPFLSIEDALDKLVSGVSHLLEKEGQAQKGVVIDSDGRASGSYWYWLDSPKLWIKAALIGGILHGPVIGESSAGVEVQQYQFRQGVLDGDYVLYMQPRAESGRFVRGPILEEGRYDAGVLDGTVRHVVDSELSALVPLKDGVLEGEAQLVAADGLIREKINFVGGQRHGPFEAYHSTAKLARKGNFANGKLSGQEILYFESGALKIKRSYGKNQEITSLEEFDEKGHLIESASMQGGVLVGRRITFFESGAKKEQIPTLDGKPHGLAQEYFENGKLRAQRPYREGHLHGEYKRYYESGELLERAQYEHGRINGTVEGFYRSGVRRHMDLLPGDR